jgi:hypothetical protein
MERGDQLDKERQLLPEETDRLAGILLGGDRKGEKLK